MLPFWAAGDMCDSRGTVAKVLAFRDLRRERDPIGTAFGVSAEVFLVLATSSVRRVLSHCLMTSRRLVRGIKGYARGEDIDGRRG